MIGQTNAIEDVKKIKLPSEYQEVEYIESTGTQYIDTGIENPYRITGEIFFNSSQSNNLAYIVGLQGNGYEFVFRRNNASKFYIRKSDKTTVSEAFPNLITNTRFTFDIDFINKKYSCGKYSGTLSNTSASFTSPDFYCPAVIFARNNYGNTPDLFAKMKLYNLQMYDMNNFLVRDYIPCYHKKDNEVGLYDLVNDVFYPNKGTGTFLIGNGII